MQESNWYCKFIYLSEIFVSDVELAVVSRCLHKIVGQSKSL